MSSGLYSGVSGLALGVGLYKNVSGLWSGSSGLIDGFGGGSPFSGASLYLDFLSGPLDSRITFSRGSNATLVDSTGRVTYAPANLATFSEFPNGVTDAPVRGGLVTGTSFAGLNSNTGLAFGYDGATTSFAYKTVAIAAVSHILSVYVRMDDGNAPSFGSSTSANPANSFVLVIGGNATNPTTYAVTNLGGGLYRVAVRDASAAGTHNNGVVKYNTNDNRTFKVSGYQLEPVTYQTTPSTYVATTASAYYGPRFDYDPVTLAPRGLLIEEQRVNLLTYSEQFDNAAWTKTGATVSANATAAPDGTTTADKLVENTATATHQIAQGANVVSGTSYTVSVYAKAAERTRLQINTNLISAGFVYITAKFDLSTGVVSSVDAGLTASIQAVGNGWYRCVVTGTAGATTSKDFILNLLDASGNASYTGNGTSGIFLWGAQLEAGAFATSYIPTVASTVTRSADVATMTGTNFSSWYNQSAGSFVVETVTFKPTSVSATGLIIDVSDGGISNRNRISFDTASAAGATVVGGVTQAALTQNYTANAVEKLAYAVAVNDFAFVRNGSVVGTDTSGTIPTVDRMFIGNAAGSAAFLNGHIRQIAYYNSRLPNAQLQSLTS